MIGYDPIPLVFQTNASTKLASFTFAQREGFEPSQAGLEAAVLPLHYRCIMQGVVA